jgi:hypothetical protein
LNGTRQSGRRLTSTRGGVRPFVPAPAMPPHTPMAASPAKRAVPFGTARRAQKGRSRELADNSEGLQSQNHPFGGHDRVREQTLSLLGDPVEHVVRVVGVVVEDDELLGLRGNR